MNAAVATPVSDIQITAFELPAVEEIGKGFSHIALPAARYATYTTSASTHVIAALPKPSHAIICGCMTVMAPGGSDTCCVGSQLLAVRAS